MTTDGIAEMRGLLTPAECEALAPPPGIAWETEEPDSPTRSWSHTQEYLFGEEAANINPALQMFLGGFREMIQLRATEEHIRRLRGWGDTQISRHPMLLLRSRQLVYGAKWHRTPASHEIGWHSDDTFDEADKDKGEEGVRALGLMVAINLSEYGGSYEYAPASALTATDGRTPFNSTDIKSIKDIKQGDAIGFCTARNSRGQHWPGSFPLHRFISDQAESKNLDGLCRDSLVIYFRDVHYRTLQDLGFKGFMDAVKKRLLERNL